MGVHEGRIIWHVDDNGVFHWGSPAARIGAIQREAGRRRQAAKRKWLRERGAGVDPSL